MKLADEINDIYEAVAAGDERDQLEAAMKLLQSDIQSVSTSVDILSSKDAKALSASLSDVLAPTKLAIKRIEKKKSVSELDSADIKAIGGYLNEIVSSQAMTNKKVRAFKSDKDIKDKAEDYIKKFGVNFKSIITTFKSIKGR